MPLDRYLIAAGITAVGSLLFLLWLVRSLRRQNRSVGDDARLWEGRTYRCPKCGLDMEQGWVLLGKGAIWSTRGHGMPGTFSHIGNTLENTISLSLRPASNMAWHCSSCRLLTLDHEKLVQKG